MDFRQMAAEIIGNDVTQRALARTQCAIVVDLDKSEVIGTTVLAQTMFGYEPEEFDGRHISTLMPEEFREKHASYISEWRLNPREIQMSRRKIACQHADGTGFSRIGWVKPVPEQDGRIKHAVIIFLEDWGQ